MDTNGNESGGRLDRIEARLNEQETHIHQQAETIRQQQQTIDRQRERLEAIEGTNSVPVGRREALQAGGLLGLLGLGAASASASPSGQIGTEARPLETLHSERVIGESFESETVDTGALDSQSVSGESVDAGTITAEEIGGSIVEGDDTISSIYPVGTEIGTIPHYEDDGDGNAVVDHPNMPEVGSTPLVDSGSNSDGEWTRFADGTQLCWGNSRSGPLPLMSPGDEYEWSFPRPFDSTADLGVVITNDTGGFSGFFIEGHELLTTSEVRIVYDDNYSSLTSGDSAHFHVLAMGRWK